MPTASPPLQKDAGIFKLLQLPETSTRWDVHAAYVTFLQEYVQEREIAKKLPPAVRKTHRFKKSGVQFKENGDTEVKKLREENNKLRKRVQQLEEVIASIQSNSTAMKKDMSDMKLSNDVFKVKVANLKDQVKSLNSNAQTHIVTHEQANMPKPYWSPNLYTAPTVLEKISKEDTTPNTVILHLGTNDLMAKPKESVISEFEVAVSTTQSLFPEAEVVISAVPPRRDASSYRPNINKDILSVNQHLESMCKTNNSLLYVNHPQLWSDNDYNEHMFEKDGYDNAGKAKANRSYPSPPPQVGKKDDNRPPPSRRGAPFRSGMPGEFRPRRNGGQMKPFSSDGSYKNGGTSHKQPMPSPGLSPNRSENTHQRAFTPPPHGANNANGPVNFCPPGMPNGPVPPAPAPFFFPPWFQEWPSPAEVYGRPPACGVLPPWPSPPPFPYFNYPRNGPPPPRRMAGQC
ncbi:actin cytoskeleton-regulatory complex protein pan1-like [Branchiostoma floridae]|uniref:Actin cytoskeleton-regulatory complex protein pan1-like n=1 Tax=Branchiostoma floridae TaxID=7739 RepID=A0A9J7HS60_BRAFL|nr:actin cytoskeleton-regulatory complex protein pan1-like [Branchiostoma floridae]